MYLYIYIYICTYIYGTSWFKTCIQSNQAPFDDKPFTTNAANPFNTKASKNTKPPKPRLNPKPDPDPTP